MIYARAMVRRYCKVVFLKLTFNEELVNRILDRYVMSYTLYGSPSLSFLEISSALALSVTFDIENITFDSINANISSRVSNNSDHLCDLV